ncbi:PspC domain-containing protein [Modestobacter italicus]|uniref:PspC domain-containing protein n=1 Tax=Modestobacter italicus (strain DSM 44449 / CECT 9708 / BC 501) TaxID=2732864 RepID=UPI001C961C9C|nr:PspC domain-containing protein [Modestobacter italicus]
MTETVHTQTPQTETPQLQAPPAGTPHDTSGRPPLQRDRTDLLVGGVAAGLARHTGIDALLWRLGFVALVFAGGAGFFLYLALWLLMPTAPARPDDRTTLLDGWVERLRAPFTRRRAG